MDNEIHRSRKERLSMGCAIWEFDQPTPEQFSYIRLIEDRLGVKAEGINFKLDAAQFISKYSEEYRVSFDLLNSIPNTAWTTGGKRVQFIEYKGLYRKRG